MNKQEQESSFSELSLKRNQLITLADLADFKSELLQDLKIVCKQFTHQNDKQWLKSHEVRKLLGISPGTLQTLRDNGTIPFTRIGNVMFYNIDDINSMMGKFKNKKN